MKLQCNCGNKMDFDLIDEDTGEIGEPMPDYGIKASIDNSKFKIWSGHDEGGIECIACGKSIWYWT